MKGKWANELYEVVWSIRTMKKTATREALFMLTSGSEVVLPIKVGFHTHCLTTFQEALNNAALYEALDLLPSVRGDALLLRALYKLRMARLHDRMVKFHPISAGDLVF